LTKTAAIIKGDGTGPELVDALIKVLKECNSNIELLLCDAGSEWWQKNGGNSYISQNVWDILAESDACFKGPTTTVPSPTAPRSVAVSIRQKFELYANVRPIKTYKNSARHLNFICVREATEGLYAGIEFKTSDESAIAIRKTTKRACDRVAMYGFKLAKEMSYNRVFAITKRNILKETDGIFIKSIENANLQFKDVKVEEYYVDNMTQQLVKNPERFNESIVISTNLFMDIISECASGHVGSIGNVYSGNYGDNYAMFEPAHGSAPKYAGLNKVNPIATILSGAWMVKFLGESDISNAIFAATEQVVNEGTHTTYDMGGISSLSQVANEIGKKASVILKR
jgi:isocitrate dehydrogenase